MPQIITGEPLDHVDVVSTSYCLESGVTDMTHSEHKADREKGRPDKPGAASYVWKSSHEWALWSQFLSFPTVQYQLATPDCFLPKLDPNVQPLYLPFALPEMCFPDWNMINAPVFVLSSNVTSSWQPSVTTPCLCAHSQFTLDHIAVCDHLFMALLTI